VDRAKQKTEGDRDSDGATGADIRHAGLSAFYSFTNDYISA
jgi:antirestriction protein ArdC